MVGANADDNGSVEGKLVGLQLFLQGRGPSCTAKCVGDVHPETLYDPYPQVLPTKFGLLADGEISRETI